MEHVGIDLGKTQSQVATVTEDGEIRQQRIRTTRERLTELFGGRPRAKILLESSMGSEWVARLLEELGHEVIVADPNFAPMYVHRTRRVKTDRRDAEALALACLGGNYRAAHRLSDEQRVKRAEVGIRESLVATRARYVTQVRSLLRGMGADVPSGSTPGFLKRLQDVEIPAGLKKVLVPMVAMLRHLNREIAKVDKRLEASARADAVTKRLMTVPGVGPVTATTFVATLDAVGRFQDARQVAAYVGLVPREWSSSEVQRRGPITKAGSRRLRHLLVEAAWSVLRYPKEDTAPLRQWAQQVATRRGKAKAAVATARKLARILFAMWRDGRDFEPARVTTIKLEAAPA